MTVQLDSEPEPATYVDSYEFIQLFVSLPADFLLDDSDTEVEEAEISPSILDQPGCCKR